MCCTAIVTCSQHPDRRLPSRLLAAMSAIMNDRRRKSEDFNILPGKQVANSQNSAENASAFPGSNDCAARQDGLVSQQASDGTSDSQQISRRLKDGVPNSTPARCLIHSSVAQDPTTFHSRNIYDFRHNTADMPCPRRTKPEDQTRHILLQPVSGNLIVPNFENLCYQNRKAWIFVMGNQRISHDVPVQVLAPNVRAL